MGKKYMPVMDSECLGSQFYEAYILNAPSVPELGIFSPTFGIPNGSRVLVKRVSAFCYKLIAIKESNARFFQFVAGIDFDEKDTILPRFLLRRLIDRA